MEFSSPSWPNDKQNIPPLSKTMLQAVFEAIYNNMDDGVFLCNNEGHVILMNTATLRLFPIASNAPSKEVTDRDIFQQYAWYNEENQYLSLEQFPLITLRTQKSSHPQECYTAIPSGSHERNIFQLYCSLVLDAQKHVSGIFCVLRPLSIYQHKEKQQILLHQSITMLIRVALEIPNLLTFPHDKEPLLLSPNLGNCGQHLADIARHVLQSEKVVIFAVGAKKQLYFVAASGLTPEQKHHRFEMNGRIALDDFFGSSAVTHFFQNDYVIQKYRQISLPPPLTYAYNPDALLLEIPILLEQQLVGILAASKNIPAYQYSEEEIFLTQSIAQLLTLLLISRRALFCLDKEQANILLHHETETLIDAFLTSASHEFRTPLTIVTGNIQLARRRLQALLHQILTPTIGQSEEMKKKMEKIQLLLNAANQGASTLDVLLDTIITDVQIHQNAFPLKKNASISRTCYTMSFNNSTTSTQQSPFIFTFHLLHCFFWPTRNGLCKSSRFISLTHLSIHQQVNLCVFKPNRSMTRSLSLCQTQDRRSLTNS